MPAGPGALSCLPLARPAAGGYELLTRQRTLNSQSIAPIKKAFSRP